MEQPTDQLAHRVSHRLTYVLDKRETCMERLERVALRRLLPNPQPLTGFADLCDALGTVESGCGL